MADAKNGYLSMVFLNMHFLLYEDLSHVIVFILLFLVLFIFAREREKDRESSSAGSFPSHVHIGSARSVLRAWNSNPG